MTYLNYFQQDFFVSCKIKSSKIHVRCFVALTYPYNGADYNLHDYITCICMLMISLKVRRKKFKEKNNAYQENTNILFKNNI